MATASEELAAMLNEEELKDAALLVFANKQDQPGAKGAGDISEALQLGELRDRNWSIMACSAVDGRGVNEGMDWLVVRCPLWSVACFLTCFSKLYRTKHHESQHRSLLSMLLVLPFGRLLFRKCFHTNLLVFTAKHAMEYPSLKLYTFSHAQILALINYLLASLDSDFGIGRY